MKRLALAAILLAAAGCRHQPPAPVDPYSAWQATKTIVFRHYPAHASGVDDAGMSLTTDWAETIEGTSKVRRRVHARLLGPNRVDVRVEVQQDLSKHPLTGTPDPEHPEWGNAHDDMTYAQRLQAEIEASLPPQPGSPR
ncbi:MAG: hypothetical protein AAB434_00315 [Planctomycetota bacterium]